MIIYKSAEQIESMRFGGNILSDVLKEAEKVVRPGMTTLELNEFIEQYIYDHNAEPGFKKVKGYSWGSCICVNDQIVHTPPSHRIIADGDVVTIDAGVYYNGLHTDSATTVQVGTKAENVTRFLEVGKEALHKAMKQAIVGNRIGHISEVFQKTIESAGFKIVPELTGHGVGKDLHEDPHVPCILNRPIGKTIELKEGMTLALEVMYAMGGPKIVLERDNWSLRMADSSLAACFEHTVAVRKNKPFILA